MKLLTEDLTYQTVTDKRITYVTVTDDIAGSTDSEGNTLKVPWNIDDLIAIYDITNQTVTNVLMTIKTVLEDITDKTGTMTITV